MYLIAKEGPLKDLILSFEEGNEWIIGRDPDLVDFILDDEAISRKHARLYLVNDDLFVENLSETNPLLVNGEAISKPHLLQEGEHVTIGHNIFLFSKKKLQKEKEGFEAIFEKNPPLEEEKPTYDTIFEEAPEEELPFNLIRETTLILKVLSGPNAGAEFGMEKGRTYIIGKDTNTCDIVFNDLTVSRQHARLHVDSEGKITIEDLKSKNKTLINSNPIEKSEVTPQDTIALGTTSFLIIDKEMAVETIYAPPPIAPRVEEKEKPPTDWRSQVIPTKHLIFAGSLILIFFIVFLSFFSLFKSQQIEVTLKDPSDEIKEALHKYEDVQFSFNPSSGKLFLVGHVLTGVDKQELTYIIEQLPFVETTEDTLIIDELVWKNMNELFADNPAWKGVNLQGQVAGKFILSGYLQTAKEFENLTDYLNINFPYLDRLENRVVVEELLNSKIASLLISKGFDNITFQLVNGNLVLAGRYDVQKDKNYRDLMEQLKSQHGIEKIENLAVPSTIEAALVDLTNKYQISGVAKRDNINFSIIANGQILSLGDFLDGMKITSIKSNIILLEKDGLKYKINYTQ